MKIKIRESILLCITILFDHLQANAIARNLTVTIPINTSPPLSWNNASTMASMAASTSSGVSETHYGHTSTIFQVTPSSGIKIITANLKSSTVLPRLKTSSLVPRTPRMTSATLVMSTSTVTTRNIPGKPSSYHPTTQTPSSSPTRKTLPKTTSTPPLVRKVGLIRRHCAGTHRIFSVPYGVS